MVEWRESSSAWGLEDESHWALQEALDFLQELRGRYPIEDPMVDREGDAHPLTGDDLAVLHHGLVLDGADREDSGVGRVDDGGELVDVVHTKVGDAEGVAQIVLRRGLVAASTLDQLPGLLGDVLERLLVGVPQHRHDQAIGKANRDPDVDVALALDAAVGPRGVDLGEFG